MTEQENREFYTVRGYEMIGDELGTLTPAMEDYLEMIYRDCTADGFARINRLAELLNVQASSATKMVQKLAAAGYVDYERYGIVRLTEKGKEVGSFLLGRHQAIETFLKNLGVKDNVLKQTELMEHSISKETVDKIKRLNRLFDKQPDLKKELL